MEKICEFCTALKPVVYCKADAAHLCLSCDARVHSANALSGRHFRTLLCQSCRNRPVYVRCMNHEMFICRNCDRTLHGFSSQHQKRLLKTYMGCPSPKDFAILWGFDVKLLDNCGNGGRFVSSSTGSEDLKSQNQFSPKMNGPSACSSDYSKSSSGSSSQQRKMNQQRDPHEDNNNILQQIIGLKRLQLTEQTHSPSQLRGKEQTEFLSTESETSQKLDENVDQSSRQFLDISNDLQLSHNMQDLGFCEEIECFEDISDVDPTFRNFEDLFGADPDPTLPFSDKEDMLSLFKNTSEDLSEDEHARSCEGASASSSDTYNQPPHQNNAISPLRQVQATVEIPNFLGRQLLLSKLSTESSFSDIHGDEGVSLILTAKGEASDGTQTYSPRYKDKKKTIMREKEKKTRYSPRAIDLKKRSKDHFTKPDIHQTKSLGSSQSY